MRVPVNREALQGGLHTGVLYPPAYDSSRCPRCAPLGGLAFCELRERAGLVPARETTLSICYENASLMPYNGLFLGTEERTFGRTRFSSELFGFHYLFTSKTQRDKLRLPEAVSGPHLEAFGKNAGQKRR